MFHRSTHLFIFLIVLSTDGFAQAGSNSTNGVVIQDRLATDRAAPAELSKEKIPIGSKVFVAPLNGYESYIIAAFVKKQTPLTVVNSAEKADYSISGVSESVQAGWAKMLILGSQQTNEQASIVMTNLKTGTVVWGYNVNKTNSYKGKQSSSEACAKHLKARIEGSGQ